MQKATYSRRLGTMDVVVLTLQLTLPPGQPRQFVSKGEAVMGNAPIEEYLQAIVRAKYWAVDTMQMVVRA